MAILTLKNIPDDLHRRLQERAARNRRSLDAEALACLEAALTEDTETLLARIRERRTRLDRVYLTEKDLQATIDAGRSSATISYPTLPQP